MGQRGQSAPLDSEKFAKNRKKRKKIRKKQEKGGKSGKRGKNREGSVTLPVLTDRAGYATVAGESMSSSSVDSIAKILSISSSGVNNIIANTSIV